MAGPSLPCTCSIGSALPVRRSLAASLAAALLAAATPALADPPTGQENGAQASGDQRPVRLQRPTAVRFTVGGFWEPDALFLGGASSDTFVAATVSRQVRDRLALELMAGTGGNSHRSGPHAGGGLRLSPIAWREHAITLALGGHAAFLRDYGPVGIGHLEAGWEMRLSGGFNLVLSEGIGFVLNDSRSSHDCSEGLLFLCRERYRAGDAGLMFHIEVGASF